MFQAKKIGIFPVWGILNVVGKKNRDFFRLCGFWTFQAKRMGICTIEGILDV
jgi:hypothetical protein